MLKNNRNVYTIENVIDLIVMMGIVLLMETMIVCDGVYRWDVFWQMGSNRPLNPIEIIAKKMNFIMVLMEELMVHTRI